MILTDYAPKGIRVVGDTWAFTTIVGGATPLDLTDATVTMTLGTSLVTATGVVADQTSEQGRVSFTFTPTQTSALAAAVRREGSLRYRIRVVFSADIADTVGSGTIKVCV